MQAAKSEERRAVEKLIQEIDELDAWRERVGRRVLIIFAGAFACALMLLVWTVMYAHPDVLGPKIPEGPRAPQVLRTIR